MTHDKKQGEIHLSSGSEKREYPRVPMVLKARYKSLSREEAEKALARPLLIEEYLHEFEEGQTIDVSKTGAMMYTNEEIPVRGMIAVSMHISVPGISCNCRAVAEVIRREKNSDTDIYAYKVALRFHKILHHNLKSYKFLDLNHVLDIRETGGH